MTINIQTIIEIAGIARRDRKRFTNEITQLAETETPPPGKATASKYRNNHCELSLGNYWG
jgi:hypothetical protein